MVNVAGELFVEGDARGPSAFDLTFFGDIVYSRLRARAVPSGSTYRITGTEQFTAPVNRTDLYGTLGTVSTLAYMVFQGRNETFRSTYQFHGDLVVVGNPVGTFDRFRDAQCLT